ncbi:hypothetical protein KP509_20G073200 [Ceratopteris richardii]|uniref:F-box domain-containing protein n=1 Tax=Ceratopteris richardii TaxID=49495 RepID=A0A8T2SH16_CERRI|nr:hypothetical protein KP509_20G073200 [Ceratopteris richardii]
MGQTSSLPSSPTISAIPSLGFQRSSFNLIDVGTSSIDQDLTLILPEECLAWIFNKLSVSDRRNCSLVCRRWHSVESVSRDRLALHAEAAIEPHLSSILSRYSLIACLSLRCGRKELSIDNAALALIGEQCTRLYRLKLKSCKAITDEGIAAFAKARGHSLKKFSAGACGFGSKGLNILLENSPKLEDLSLKRLRKMVDDPQPILPGASGLRRLCIKEIMCTHIFVTLITGSKHLRILVLARNSAIWDLFFKLICKELPELVELHIDSLRIGSVALASIANCTNLEVLHVSKVSECSDAGFTEIAHGCRNLKKLYIDGRCPNPMGEEGLLALGKHCLKLQELVLIGVNVTRLSLDTIVTNCNVLERMALCSTEAVGDAELACIAEKCSSLKKLCIKNCPISDVGIEGLLKGCPNLTKVKVKRCKDVTIISSMLFQLRRPTVTASLDTPELRIEEEPIDGPQHDGLLSAALLRNRMLLGKSRLILAAGNLLRRFPKAS